jgi:hypothetical protein
MQVSQKLNGNVIKNLQYCSIHHFSFPKLFKQLVQKAISIFSSEKLHLQKFYSNHQKQMQN